MRCHWLGGTSSAISGLIVTTHCKCPLHGAILFSMVVQNPSLFLRPIHLSQMLERTLYGQPPDGFEHGRVNEPTSRYTEASYIACGKSLGSPEPR